MFVLLVPPLPPLAVIAAPNQRPVPPLANGLLLTALVPARALARPTSKTAVLALARPILARAPPATIILLTAIAPEAVLAILPLPRAGVALQQPQPTRQSATQQRHCPYPSKGVLFLPLARSP